MNENENSTVSAAEKEKPESISDKAGRPKKKRTAKDYALSFFIKVGLTVLAVWVIFTFIAGIHICHENNVCGFKILR